MSKDPSDLKVLLKALLKVEKCTDRVYTEICNVVSNAQYWMGNSIL
ncbi:MAG: hypothetical protein QW547_02875 [Candidatus Bathyarchaeia archaeon]